MNYYLFSLITGIIATIIFYCIQYCQKNKLNRESYIKFFIYSTLLSLLSIYGYLSINNMINFDLRNNIPILTGKANF